MKQYIKQHDIFKCVIKTPFTWVMASLLFIFAASPMSAIGDDYLDALSTEAEASAHVPANAGTAGPSKEQLALEKLLEKEKPTTFKYYNKLNRWDKATVVELYRTDNADTPAKFDHLRKKILDLYFKR
ncbi:MAG: hypothetical protein L3J98_02155 [Gammaproteobacteria bacterium]|nr:hypothetical protein [Gammaproteobacteria bacterium]